MSGYIKTMKDLEAASYGIRGGSGNALLKAQGVVGGLVGTAGASHDASTAFLSSNSAISDLYNVVYGQKVWSMLNQEANALAMLSKRPYTSSGWRILKSRAAGGSGNAFDLTGTGAVGADDPRPSLIGGLQENATIADGDFLAITPTYTKLWTSPKTVAHLFEFSELALEMAKIDDGVGDIRALIREDMGKHHAEVQNVMLLMPMEQYDTATTLTKLGQGYTSLMKIVSSFEEITEMRDNTMIATTSGTVPTTMTNLFGTTRTATTGHLDAEVDFGAGYGATEARVLTLTILNDMLRKLREAGGSPKVILTGYDTIQHLGDLLQAQERFLDRKEVIPTHNGVRGVKGSEVGFRVATYYDIPIIPCKDMPKTGKHATAAEKLSDILILDTDHLWLSVMKPTQYFEDGIDHGNPFGVGKLGNQAIYRTVAETACSFFKGQGKITNLKSA